MGNEQIEDIYLLTPMQQGILFHTLFAPEVDPYFVQTAYTIRGRVDAAALEAAGQSVVGRHPALRATPVWEGRAKPVQVVWRRAALPLRLHDWRGLAPDEQERRFESLLSEEARRGFDLKSVPLMRHTLVSLSDDTCKYVLSNHHLILDGWSSAAVLKEMLLTYEALRRGEELTLGSPRPFREYIAWLRRQDADAAEAFWHAKLRGFRAPTPLGMTGGAPGDTRKGKLRGAEERPPDGDGFAEKRLRLSEGETARLREFARRQQVTLNTLAQCAWALLLSRYCGETDVAFGSVVSGRPAELEGADDMIGLFINTLPVRARVDGSAAVGEWLRAAQAEAVEARRYEYSPLAEVQRWSEVAPGAPLFESVLVFENYPVDQMLQTRVGDLTITDIRGRERTGYPLTLIAGHAGDRLGVLVIYDERRFDGGLVENMLRHFETLLGEMAADPARRLSELTLLSEEERARLLFEFNDTEHEYPASLCLQHLFEAQAARTPDAEAVIFRGERLSYAELDARANRLTRRLRQLGVSPESRVAVMLERSAGLVVALLAVLKAGGAYVPLDPSYPAERLRFMLADCRPAALLTDSALAAGLTPEWRGHAVLLDADGEAVSAESTADFGLPLDPDGLAYVIYTSGSTGHPKGAMNTHRAVVNRLLWMQDQYRLTPDDTVMQKTPYSFDVSVWEFFWPLLAGARLVVAEPGGHQDPSYLVSLIERERVTTVHFVPSMLQAFLPQADASRCATLRRVICSGETLSRELQGRFEGRFGAELHNLYGPTEAAVDVTHWSCERGDRRRSVPIGRPVANTRIYILDGTMQPTPVGVSGELYIGGAQVARGYLGRPGLTAERFVPDPFSAEPGGRLYRTGDLAGFMPGGEVEYMGRLDFQVKVRGFRIELGEVEAALARYPAVRECVVMAGGAASGEKRLVAYLVCREGPRPTVTDLRLFAGKSLPDYMIPSGFVFMDTLPLTSNGKVDRRALPDSEAARPELAQSFVAPSAPNEAELVGLWSEVLGVERVGAEDNFFDLGGHSLLLVQLHGKVHQTFQTDISLVELFEYPTVRAQAQRISGRGRADVAAAGAEAAEGLRAGRDRLQRQRMQRQSAS